MAKCTVWIAYNTEDNCFASHESAQEALDGLQEYFDRGEGIRVVEMQLTLPSVKPLAVQATVPDRDGPVSIKIE